MRSYAIGDIHGHSGPLQEAHRRIARDRERTGDAEAPVVHLGDLVDRGPDSAGVISFLMDGIARGEPWEVLRGNHDQGFIDWMEAPDAPVEILPDDYWWAAEMGGFNTLASYGVPPRASMAEVHDTARVIVPQAHLDFLAARPMTLQRGEALFVHAGIRPGVPLDRQDPFDLIWIREPFLSDRRDHGPLVVHGHTAIPTASHHGNRVNIDSSMAFGGHLTAIVIEGREVWELTGKGRQPLRP